MSKKTERSYDSLLSKNTTEVTQTTVSDSLNNRGNEVAETGQTSTQSTYETFFSLLKYSKMFITRLGKDLYQSGMFYFYSDQVLPSHIVDLMRIQNNLQVERESPRPRAPDTT